MAAIEKILFIVICDAETAALVRIIKARNIVLIVMEELRIERNGATILGWETSAVCKRM